MKQTAFRAAVIGLTLALLSSIAVAGGYLLTFDGTPPAPLIYRPAMSFDTVVHVNDDRFTPVNAGHGPACEAPPAMHLVQTFDESVYQCKDHIMTALFAPGYGAIYLTPNQLLDFSAGEADVQFDVSTLRTSDRDWIDLWVTPWADQLELPLDAFLPDLNGDPRNAIHIRMDNFGGGSGFRAYVIRDFVVTELPITNDFGIEQVLATSATIRTTFELKLSSTSLSFGMPGTNSWWHLNNTFAPLSWTAGVVQFGHHSYNPMKDGGTNLPDTWHWDNFNISPAIPFTIIESDHRRADATAPAVTFAAPAPGGSNLRFDARGSNIQVSFDGGAWQAAGRQAVAKPDQDEVFKSYWMPIPAGATSVAFRGTNFCCGPWAVRDASIFSLAAPGTTAPPPVPTASPTVAPTATPSAAPTAAPTATPTAAPTSTLTATATPARTVAPTATPSPTSSAVATAGPTSTPPQQAAPTSAPLPAPFAAIIPALAPAPQISAASYHSAWVDQSDYPVLQPGATTDVTLHFRNTGSAPWVKGAAGQQANLGVWGDGTPFVYSTAQAFYQAIAGDEASGLSFDGGTVSRVGSSAERAWTLVATDWPTSDRPAVQSEAVVQPGAVGTFSFKVRAPVTPGVYPLWLRPVIDGTTWMDNQGVYLLVTSRADYLSAWVSQSAYPTVRAGTTSQPITVRFQNVGTQPWVKGTLGQQTNLGVVGNAAAWSPFVAGWPTPDRVAVQQESVVRPGETATFTFQVHAPSTPGDYVLRLRPVVDGTTWLRDEGVYILVRVTP